MSEQYTIKFFGDEARVVLSTCLTPHACTCKAVDKTQCCYSATEVHQQMIKYYWEKAQYLDKITTEEFLNDQGFYPKD